MEIKLLLMIESNSEVNFFELVSPFVFTDNHLPRTGEMIYVNNGIYVVQNLHWQLDQNHLAIILQTVDAVKNKMSFTMSNN
jgi:hypothetical protein